MLFQTLGPCSALPAGAVEAALQTPAVRLLPGKTGHLGSTMGWETRGPMRHPPHISGLLFINSHTGIESKAADAAGLLHLPAFLSTPQLSVSFSLTQLCSTVFILANESLPTHARASKTPTDQRRGRKCRNCLLKSGRGSFFARGQRNTAFSRDPEQAEVRHRLLPQGLKH